MYSNNYYCGRWHYTVQGVVCEHFCIIDYIIKLNMALTTFLLYTYQFKFLLFKSKGCMHHLQPNSSCQLGNALEF